jgi:phospholipid/cholesterol/gamma-HCH transport system substrate-binding protein
MENKSHALAAGAFVLLVSALLVALAMWLTRDVALRTVYELSTREPVTGLQVQAAVRFRGIPVGKVLSIDFDPKIAGNVRVSISVDDTTPITESTFATLGFQGVTGLSFVQLDDTGGSSVGLESKDGEVARIPLRPGLFSKLTDQGASAMAQLEETTRRLNALLAPEQQKVLLDAVRNMGQAAGSINQLSLHLDQLLQGQGGPGSVSAPQLAQEVSATLKALQATSAEASRTAQEGSKAASELARVAQRLHQSGGSLDQLNQGVEVMALTAKTLNASTLPRVAKSADDVARAARRVERTTANLNENPQVLLYGTGVVPPGPGEPGFTAPQGTK